MLPYLSEALCLVLSKAQTSRRMYGNSASQRANDVTRMVDHGQLVEPAVCLSDLMMSFY